MENLITILYYTWINKSRVSFTTKFIIDQIHISAKRYVILKTTIHEKQKHKAFKCCIGGFSVYLDNV